MRVRKMSIFFLVFTMLCTLFMPTVYAEEPVEGPVTGTISCIAAVNGENYYGTAVELTRGSENTLEIKSVDYNGGAVEAGNLRYQWCSDANGNVKIEGANSPTYSFKYSGEEAYSCWVTILTEEGKEESFSETFLLKEDTLSVSGNSDPEAVYDEEGTYVIYDVALGSKGTLNVSGKTTLEGKDLSYKWAYMVQDENYSEPAPIGNTTSTCEFTKKAGTEVYDCEISDGNKTKIVTFIIHPTNTLTLNPKVNGTDPKKHEEDAYGGTFYSYGAEAGKEVAMQLNARTSNGSDIKYRWMHKGKVVSESDVLTITKADRDHSDYEPSDDGDVEGVEEYDCWIDDGNVKKRVFFMLYIDKNVSDDDNQGDDNNGDDDISVWDAYEIKVEPTGKMILGQETTLQISVTNSTKAQQKLRWFNNFYYRETDNSETYPGIDFGVVKDSQGNEVTYENSKEIVFAAGETKTYTLTGVVPVTWNDKSEILIVIASTGEDGKGCHGQGGYMGKVGEPEGNITTEVEGTVSIGDNSGGVKDDSWKYAVLTPEEVEVIKDGSSSIEVKFNSEQVEESTLPSKEIEAIRVAAVAEKVEIAQILDLSIQKTITYSEGDKETKEVTNLNAPIDVVIPVPEEYRASGRVFSVIRLHDDEVTVLDDQDENPNTVTISTDRFSYYTLAYTDTPGSEPGEDQKPGTNPTPGENGSGTTQTGNGNAATNNGSASQAGNASSAQGSTVRRAPQTGDSASISLWLSAALFAAGICWMVRRSSKAGELA